MEELQERPISDAELEAEYRTHIMPLVYDCE
jgi:hypothetical protein